MIQLPTLSPELRERSRRLLLHLQMVANEQGSLSFAEYMRHCLYDPTFGYYASSKPLFGEAGDFVTAPELSPLFAQTLARQITEVLEQIDSPAPVVFELGAGSGRLCADILRVLAQNASPLDRYYILELSGTLRATQRRTIAQIAPDMLARVQWLDRWPESFDGVAIGNEVLDAMPVERFAWRDQQAMQLRLRCTGDQLKPFYANADGDLAHAIRRIAEDTAWRWPSGFESEINCLLGPWFRGLAKAINCGALLLFDYGYPRREYYHPERSSGTLRCYLQHHAHSDPLINIGAQDITAHVDFTAAAEAGTTAGLVLEGFTRQRQFLLNCGLADIAAAEQRDANSLQRLKISQQMQKLTLPSQMGDVFNVIGFSRNLPKALMGFVVADQAYRL